jgi:hypothetical protein
VRIVAWRAHTHALTGCSTHSHDALNLEDNHKLAEAILACTILPVQSLLFIFSGEILARGQIALAPGKFSIIIKILFFSRQRALALFCQPKALTVLLLGCNLI